jgi:enoyl-CoA hydratase/carnithine racemase
MSSAQEILLERRGALGVVTLNRPQALNTLSLGMYRAADPQLVAWERDPAIRAILVQSAGGKAFCAGGDVRAIHDARGQGGDGDYKSDFFREEYWLIERIHRSRKPHIALVDGITMGGGMGISINGSHRVATERTLMAMPEVHIGLFPDVGATRFLNLCPGKIGLYLALTGTRIKAVDALYCGFATHYVPHERLSALVSALLDIAWRDGEERGQVDELMARFNVDAGPTRRSAAGNRPLLFRRECRGDRGCAHPRRHALGAGGGRGDRPRVADQREDHFPATPDWRRGSRHRGRARA